MDNDLPTQDRPLMENQSPVSESQERRQRQIIIGVIVGAIVFIAILAGTIYALLLPTTDTAKIRDVFIIFMALESLVLMLTLAILIVQLARLINLLQNEVKPILDSTNETVSTLRGTTEFLSDNLVEPVMKLNEYLAGLQQVLKVVGLARSNKQKSNNS